MTDEYSPIARPSRQEKNGFLCVTPTPADKASGKSQLQLTSSQPQLKTGKRPFGGGEILGEPLTKRSRLDENDEARRTKERKPRVLDPAMLTKHFTMANKKEIEKVKARIASATPSNPTDIPPRTTRHAEPVILSMATGKPILSKSLREAPPLHRDTPSKERRDALLIPRENISKPRRDISALHKARMSEAQKDTPIQGTKANPISFSPDLNELDREFREGSGYYSQQEEDEVSFISPWSEGPRGPSARQALKRDEPLKDHYQPPRRTSRPEERRRRDFSSVELEMTAKKRRTLSNSCGVSPRSEDRSRSRSRLRSLVKKHDRYRGDGAEMPWGRNARFDRALSRRPPPALQRPRDKTPPPSRQVRREERSRSRGARKNRGRSRGADRERSPRRERSPERKRSRQRRRSSSRHRNRDRRDSPDQHNNKRRSRSPRPSKQPPSASPPQPPPPPSPSESFFGADDIPEPHETLGVGEGEYTLEQEMALFGLAVTVYVQRERVAELMLNRMRLQFDLDNRKKRCEEGDGVEENKDRGERNGDGNGEGRNEKKDVGNGDGGERGSKERVSRERKESGGRKECS
ncbi:hypothetical protein BKA58DRAFT_442211 [Alternaria rosae]|uniref:uncharacterized protein n=1 Tax=Alternaria rosae TaxID=1187941 RepID=UPI001E8E76C5|nr:uncharacterized protein BKA58DRAFT_442211 [Alternaria rosae]KAH6865426.1 hypothetical protein BKA58DRAFT_442211 [Alternaria rosae]